MFLGFRAFLKKSFPVSQLGKLSLVPPITKLYRVRFLPKHSLRLNSESSPAPCHQGGPEAAVLLGKGTGEVQYISQQRLSWLAYEDGIIQGREIHFVLVGLLVSVGLWSSKTKGDATTKSRTLTGIYSTGARVLSPGATVK